MAARKREARKVGRPTVEPGGARTERVVVLLTVPEREQLERLAARDKLLPGAWLYRQVAKALRRK